MICTTVLTDASNSTMTCDGLSLPGLDTALPVFMAFAAAFLILKALKHV